MSWKDIVCMYKNKKDIVCMYKNRPFKYHTHLQNLNGSLSKLKFLKGLISRSDIYISGTRLLWYRSSPLGDSARL